ncbi:MAG: site-specific integrase, partial [Clostridia bacterium]|nr:site-specific integrase [Clostridia bacterium]
QKNKKSGLWSVRVREIRPDGTAWQPRISGKFKTKREAQEAFLEYERKKKEEAENVIPEDGAGAVPFVRYAEQYLAFQEGRIKESSRYDIRSRLKNHICPFFGKTPIKDITPLMISEWEKSLSRFSFGYKKTLFSTFGAVLSYAERYHDIINVMRKVEKPRRIEAKKEMQIYTPKEFEAFLACVENPEHALFFHTLFVTGMRLGEALALSWQDVDLTERTIRVRKNISRKVHDEGKTYAVLTPKNAQSDRRIPIPVFLAEKLKKRKKEQGAGGSFLFGKDRPLSASTLTRAIEEAAEKAGVKRIRIHDFRHSCASLLLHKKVNIVAVSRLLGHASVTQTLNTYGHMLPDDHKEILASMKALDF